MRTRMIFAVSAIAASLVTTGCNHFGLHSSFFNSYGSGEKMDIQKRAILSGSASPTARVCAEPSPDAMSAMAMEAAAKGGVPSKVQVELSAALQQSAAFVGLRTSSIQLLRDFGYRLCEAYLSGAISPGQYDLLMRRFQKNVVALLAIEQLTGAVKAPPVTLTTQGRAETAQSLSDQRDVREKVSEKIAELEKQKKKKETEKTALENANPKGDTTEVVEQIAEKETEIKFRKGDLEAIDKSIATARGTLVEGQATATVHSESYPTTRSDAAMQKVADAVENISMAIVKSDDIVQLCLMILRDSIGSQDATKTNFAAWCQKELELDQKGRGIYLASLANEIAAKEAMAADSNRTPAERKKAQDELIPLKRKL